jgi:hypothetical protein
MYGEVEEQFQAFLMFAQDEGFRHGRFTPGIEPPYPLAPEAICTYREEKILTLPEIEPRSFGCVVGNLIITHVTDSQVPDEDSTHVRRIYTWSLLCA